MTQVTTTGVRINIEDVNDNLPRFEGDEYARVIEEGADHFEPPLIIKATDLDGPNQVRKIALLIYFYCTVHLI